MSRDKTPILFILFAGLALAGGGILARQIPDEEIPDAPFAIETSRSESDSSLGGPEAPRENLRLGPPALFPLAEGKIWTRADYYRAFRRLYLESPDLFRDRARQALGGPYPLEAQQAALAAWYCWNYRDSLSPFRRIMERERTDMQDKGGTASPLESYVVGFLAQEAAVGACKAASDSREILATYIESKPTDPELRKQAWTAVLRWGQIKEIQRSLPSLYAEDNPGCIQASADALKQTRAGGAQAMLLELSKRHPRRAARKLFKSTLALR